MNNKERIDRLHNTHSLAAEDYAELAGTYTLADAVYAASLANAARRQYYGNDVYIRGLIEVGNVCRNDCLYCGIRRSNKSCQRYVLTKEEILSCCIDGYELGFRTFVLQGGEGVMPAEKLCGIVSEIRKKYLDCAITLSFGEYPRRDYKNMYAAGANRYLLRHETANKQHYEKLHPASMSFDNRMRCLRDLKEIGFQVGCGFMVGSPYQTTETLAEDLKFIEGFQPDMCGIGPFIPHEDTPFGAYPAGRIDLTVFLLSLVRLIKPNILLPATTALGSVEEGGRERGIRAGANVVMPNLSPFSVREKYAVSKGATIHFGGKRHDNFIEPTVISGVEKGMDLYDKECFGPVVTLIACDGDEDGLRIANDSPYGLEGAVFSRDISRAMKLADALEVGGVVINASGCFRPGNVPYMPRKESGIGTDNMFNCYEEMTCGKAVVIANATAQFSGEFGK